MAAAVFSATYADWRLVKTRQVVQIVLEVPLHKADQAYKTMGGMPDPATEKWFAVAAIKREGEKPSKRLVTQAAITCNDPLFRLYLEKHLITSTGQTVIWPPRDPELTAARVRHYCGVASRSEILPGTPAGEKWDNLYGNFLLWRDADKYVTQDAAVPS